MPIPTALVKEDLVAAAVSVAMAVLAAVVVLVVMADAYEACASYA